MCPRQRCFLLPIPPLSSPPVAGATSIVYPPPLRNSFRFLCNKFKKLKHYCNCYEINLKYIRIERKKQRENIRVYCITSQVYYFTSFNITIMYYSYINKELFLSCCLFISVFYFHLQLFYELK